VAKNFKGGFAPPGYGLDEHRSEQLKHFGAKEVRYSSKCTMFF